MTSVQRDLTDAIRALLGQGERATPDAYASALKEFGPADHVAIALIESSTGQCLVIGSSGGGLISAGTSVTADASTRLSHALEKRVWQSSDFSRESNYSLIIDQMARTAGLHSGCGIPIVVDGDPVAVICPSAVRTDVDWTEMVTAVQHVEPLLRIGLKLVDIESVRPKVLILHRDPLVGHGLARLVESALAAEILFADGPGDPRLGVFVRSADVVVLDVALPGLTMEEILSAIRSHGSSTPIVVVADAPPQDAEGEEVVLRSTVVADLVPAVLHAISALRRRPSSTGGVAQLQLTNRERELLSELDTGASFQMIASRMGLATTTVRSYSRGLFAKLGVHSRGEAVYEGRRRALL